MLLPLPTLGLQSLLLTGPAEVLQLPPTKERKPEPQPCLGPLAAQAQRGGAGLHHGLMSEIDTSPSGILLGVMSVSPSLAHSSCLISTDGIDSLPLGAEELLRQPGVCFVNIVLQR